MKRILALLTIALSIDCFGGQILWTGLNDGIVIDDNGTRIGIENWINSLACSPGDVAFRIRIGDTPLRIGYDDPSGYIPPGQSAPTTVFDSPELGEQYDAGVLVVDSNWEPIVPYMYSDYSSVELNTSDKSVTVFYELGYWDANADWEFVPMAYAWDSLGNLWSPHTYETGTLGPTTQTPWRPSVFYTSIPEPSVSALALLGLIMLVRRRK